MKSLESLNFMLGLIKEEPGDLWLKTTDEGLVLHEKCAVAGLCLNAIYSALIDSEATELLMNVDRE